MNLLKARRVGGEQRRERMRVADERDKYMNHAKSLTNKYGLNKLSVHAWNSWNLRNAYKTHPKFVDVATCDIILDL